MDYEQKYKIALERAKNFKETCNSAGIISWCEYIFPELKESKVEKPNGGIVSENFNEGDGFYKVNLAYLSKEQVEEIERLVKKWNPEIKESEDEKIRKQIISFLKEFECDHYRSLDFSSWIAWLEKQGEQKYSWSEEDEKKRTLLIRILEVNHPNGYFKVNPANTSNIEAIHTEELVSWLKSLRPQNRWTPSDKQGEQKPINTDFKAKDCYVSEVDGKIHIAGKFEPKFKVGDFIANDYCRGKVVELTNDAYLLDTGQGIPFSCEHNVHLWTIEDAKEGDVLAGKIDGDSYILIYKQIKDGWIETYGHYYDSVDRFCVPSQLFCREVKGTFCPATKEQRDLLFQKMKKDGYEWNADGKVLIKL